MKTWMVETQALKKYYRLGENTVKALDGVDLTVERGEFVAMIGKSGSGKSTPLHMLGGLDTPTSGEVFVDGKKLSELKKEQLAIFRRRKVGFVFQNYNLVPDLNVYENIVLPIELDGGYVDEKIYRGTFGYAAFAGKRQRHFRGRCPAASSNAWRSRGHLHRNRRSFLQMSRPETWTPEQVMRCWDFCALRQNVFRRH